MLCCGFRGVCAYVVLWVQKWGSHAVVWAQEWGVMLEYGFRCVCVQKCRRECMSMCVCVGVWVLVGACWGVGSEVGGHAGVWV